MKDQFEGINKGESLKAPWVAIKHIIETRAYMDGVFSIYCGLLKRKNRSEEIDNLEYKIHSSLCAFQSCTQILQEELEDKIEAEKLDEYFGPNVVFSSYRNWSI